MPPSCPVIPSDNRYAIKLYMSSYVESFTFTVKYGAFTSYWNKAVNVNTEITLQSTSPPRSLTA